MTDTDANIKVKVSSNKMRAYATYIPASGNGIARTGEERVEEDRNEPGW